MLIYAKPRVELDLVYCNSFFLLSLGSLPTQFNPKIQGQFYKEIKWAIDDLLEFQK